MKVIFTGRQQVPLSEVFSMQRESNHVTINVDIASTLECEFIRGHTSTHVNIFPKLYWDFSYLEKKLYFDCLFTKQVCGVLQAMEGSPYLH